MVAEDKLTEPAYTSPAGPIAPIDILYGLRSSMTNGNLYMSHRCGFTEKVLSGTLKVATTKRGHPYFDLWALGTKQDISDDKLISLAQAHFTPK